MRFIAIFFSHISTRRTDATLQWRGHPVQFSSIKRINETRRAALPYSLTWMKFLNESSSHGRESSCNDRWLEYSLGKNVGGASSLTFDGRIDAPLDLLAPFEWKNPTKSRSTSNVLKRYHSHNNISSHRSFLWKICIISEFVKKRDFVFLCGKISTERRRVN